MSPEQDPGQVHSRPADELRMEAPEVAAPEVAAPEDDDRAVAPDDDRSGRDAGDLAVAMSPRQIIGGFVLLAGLIVMLRRRRRKG